MSIDTGDVQTEVKEACRRVALDADTRAEITDIVVSKYIDLQDELNALDAVERALSVDEVQDIFHQVGVVKTELSIEDQDLDITFSRDFEHNRLNPDIVLDGRKCILGRIASEVAERALTGERIVVLNAEDIVITGNKRDIVDKYRSKIEVGSDSGPRYPKQPDRIVKRAIRGMLPFKTSRGREAFKNIRVYIGTPDEYDGAAEVPTNDKKVFLNRSKTKDFVTIGEISTSLGATKRW